MTDGQAGFCGAISEGGGGSRAARAWGACFWINRAAAQLGPACRRDGATPSFPCKASCAGSPYCLAAVPPRAHSRAVLTGTCRLDGDVLSRPPLLRRGVARPPSSSTPPSPPARAWTPMPHGPPAPPVFWVSESARPPAAPGSPARRARQRPQRLHARPAAADVFNIAFRGRKGGGGGSVSYSPALYQIQLPGAAS